MIKRTFSITALFCMLLLAGSMSTEATAQQLKVGYTDSERILVNMPAYQDVQQKLQQEAQNQQQQLQSQMQGFQQEVQQFQQEQSLLSEQKRKEREQQLMQRRQELQQSQQQQQQELLQMEQKLMNPVLTDLQTAIDEVAEQRNLDMVLESRAMLYVNEEASSLVDITPAVADNLGLEPPEGGEGVNVNTPSGSGPSN